MCVIRPGLEISAMVTDCPAGTGEKVLDLLFQEQRERGLSLLLVTHDERVARRCERVVYMDDGQIGGDTNVPIPH